MSMILDALSRAERERRHEQHHVLDAGRYVPSSPIKEDRYKKWLLIALLVNFIVIIAILLGYLWKTGAFSEVVTNESPPPTIISKHEMTEPVEPPVPMNAPQVTQNNIEPRLTQSDNSSLLNEAQTEKKSTVVTKKIAPKAVAPVPPVSYSNKPIAQNKKPSIPVEELLSVQKSNKNSSYMLLTDLAPAQRSKLSNYEVNVHVYNEDPQKSFVLINMTKYKEGDRLPGGKEHVDKVVPEGVVIDFGAGRVLIERN
ncbi:MAG: general secretion pathway protein GspB [Pseudomonadota bacterium]